MAQYTILYVDDEPDLLLLGKTFLEKLGDVAVDTQESATDGLEALREKSYDAIISDYQMPVMDGLAFLKAVRAEFGNLPFILFTGRGREDVVIEAINSGADFYLQKGGDVRSQFAELSHKINMAVGRKRAMDALHGSEKRLSSLFHASPIHQMVTDFSTGKIIDINDRYLKDLRISRKDAIGKTIAELGLIPDPIQYSAIQQQLAAEGMIRNAELHVRVPDGRTFTTLASLTRVQVPGQDLVYTQSMDISVRKKAQQTIDALLNAPPDASMLLDMQGTILAVNQAASTRFHTPVEDLLGKNAYTLVSPQLADLRREKIEEAAKTKTPLVFIDDRTGRIYENHVYPEIGPDGGVATVAVYSRDVTEERQAKDALRQSEEKYRLVVENSHDSIYIHRDNHFLFINRQAEELTGFTHDELMKREIWDFIHPDDRGRLKEASLQRFAGGHLSTVFSARILTKNGEERDGEFFVDVVEFLGRPAILGICRDVTERKQVEAAILEREEQIRSLADNLPLGMVYQVERDPDGKQRYVHVSAGVEVIHEVSPEDVIRDPMVLYSQIFPEDFQRVREAEEHSHMTMSFFSTEARIRTPSGKERWVLLRSAPRPLPGGGTLWDGIELDVTATKHAEEELKGAYEQLTASQEELRSQLDQLRESQEQIAESEAKYRTLVSHTEDGVFLAHDGILLFVNEPYAAMVGYTVGELTGKAFDFLVAPEDREMVVSRHLDRITGDALPESYEFSVLHKDGKTRVRVKIRVGTGIYNGKRVAIGTLRNITDERQRETALIESEELHRRMLATIPDIVVRTDVEGKIISVNDIGVKAGGFDSPDDLIGKSMLSFIAPECQEQAVTNTRLMFEGPLGPKEYTLIVKGDVRLRLEVNGDVLRSPEGTPYGLIYICRDISDRKKAEEAIRQSEELYRSLFMASPDGITLVDTRGILTYASPQALKFFGLSDLKEALGTSVIDWICPEDRITAMERFRKVLTDNAFSSNKYHVQRKDGSRFVVEMHSAALHYRDGSVRGIISILRDITDRQRTEEALRRSEEDYRNIIENMQDVFYRVNREGMITMISPYGARIVGYESPADIAGKLRSTDFYADPREQDALMAVLLEKKVISGYPLSLKDRYGNLHDATANSRLLFDENGNIDGVEGILHDVTQLKAIENALRQANRQITLMTSITRHDIRNQLLALGGWLEFARASVSDPETILELITKAQKIAGIIEQQINFTEIIDDMGVKAPSWQDPAQVTGNAWSSLPAGNIRLEAEISDVEIFSDLLFEKVFYNLFDNALRYGGETMSRIRVSAHPEKEFLLVVVEDDGTGITAGDKARLFERGFGKNTGFGLFLVREILSVTGITITENGNAGTGARFEMRIPENAFRYKK
ncbi:PAS domain S-box protein [uncultured Methanoregula sp.]|uniref:PAS domain S-box protein n=1 Tax=uncultured Methanoregula sp. TaxID=1005933 RepID=UPI002AAA691E|nr:PAS domain S-box protein [uncultured Methanoregula sp.]